MGGADILVELRLGISPITGKPFVWDENYQNRLEVDLSTYTVPEEFLPYTAGRDGAYYTYKKLTTHRRECSNEAAADEFWSCFPEWSAVKAELDEEDSWSEEDHNAFAAAAEWFAARRGFIWVWPFA
jgi:hypothetical protein